MISRGIERPTLFRMPNRLRTISLRCRVSESITRLLKYNKSCSIYAFLNINFFLSIKKKKKRKKEKNQTGCQSDFRANNSCGKQIFVKCRVIEEHLRKLFQEEIWDSNGSV